MYINPLKLMQDTFSYIATHKWEISLNKKQTFQRFHLHVLPSNYTSGEQRAPSNIII